MRKRVWLAEPHLACAEKAILDPDESRETLMRSCKGRGKVVAYPASPRRLSGC